MEAIDPYVLFVVEKPRGDLRESQDLKWKDFCSNVFANDIAWPQASSMPHEIPSRRIADNVWLLPLKDSMPFVGRLVAVAKNVGLSYRCIFLDGEPQWETWESQAQSG